MFILSDEFFKKINVRKFAKANEYNFCASYEFWKDNLFERCMRLFVYKNLPETLPRKEIEQMLLLQGYAVLTKINDKLYSFYANLSDYTKLYYDEPKMANLRSPIYANSLAIDKDCVLVDNTSCRNSIFPLINHYATLLAHCTMTMQNVLVNARDANGTPIANTEQQKNAVQKYYSDLWNGKKTCVLDNTMLGIEFAGQHGVQAISIKDIMETINNLIDNFYNDIGVKTSKDKKGNMLTPEIESDNPMLLLNINDMLESRKIGLAKVNAKYGENIIVDIAEEIKTIERSNYNAESDN